jgi:hypothetical protein
VIHKVPIVYNYQKQGLGKICLSVVDLNVVGQPIENEWAGKFKNIAENPKKRAFYSSLKKCESL